MACSVDNSGSPDPRTGREYSLSPLARREGSFRGRVMRCDVVAATGAGHQRRGLAVTFSGSLYGPVRRCSTANAAAQSEGVAWPHDQEAGLLSLGIAGSGRGSRGEICLGWRREEWLESRQHSLVWQQACGNRPATLNVLIVSAPQAMQMSSRLAPTRVHPARRQPPWAGPVL